MIVCKEHLKRFHCLYFEIPIFRVNNIVEQIQYALLTINIFQPILYLFFLFVRFFDCLLEDWSLSALIKQQLTISFSNVDCEFVSFSSEVVLRIFH
jgi:hypothetical protein